MTIGMKIQKVLCAGTLGIAGLLAVIFLVDLLAGIFFGRQYPMTDMFVVLACGLIIWQGLETWFEL